jgi:hypothetical protein
MSIETTPRSTVRLASSILAEDLSASWFWAYQLIPAGASGVWIGNLTSNTWWGFGAFLGSIFALLILLYMWNWGVRAPRRQRDQAWASLGRLTDQFDLENVRKQIAEWIKEAEIMRSAFVGKSGPAIVDTFKTQAAAWKEQVESGLREVLPRYGEFFATPPNPPPSEAEPKNIGVSDGTLVAIWCDLKWRIERLRAIDHDLWQTRPPMPKP